MSELRRRRVRGHAIAQPPARAAGLWMPRPDDAALLLHVGADARDCLAVATVRELVATSRGQLTISERLFTPAADLDDLRAVARGTRPDVAAGLDLEPVRIDSDITLGQLVCRRSYTQRWPVVGWHLDWTLGRLTVYAGRAGGGRDGFSVGLGGTGTYRDGVWVPSWHYPRLTMTPRSGGQPGAFLGWVPPRDPTAWTTRRAVPADFLDLQVLASAVAGTDVDDPAQACDLFAVTWPGQLDEPVDRLRAEAAALAHLYGAVIGALVSVAPALAPRDVWSFGSIATHLLTAAGVVAPLGKAAHGVAS